MENAALLIDLLLRLTTQAQSYAALLHRSRSEGRDVTKAELQGLKDDYAAAHAEIEALIASKS